MITYEDYEKLLAFSDKIKKQVRKIGELDDTRPDLGSIMLSELRHTLDDMDYLARTLRDSETKQFMRERGAVITNKNFC